MADLILVHGAWHGAWCWEELIPALEAHGHHAYAVNLPGSGDDPTPPAEVTLESYAVCVADRARASGRTAWLVGHSMGGLAITQAAEHAADQLQGLIYVTAFMPRDGQSLLDLAALDPNPSLRDVAVIDPATTTATVPAKDARRIFYGACSDSQAARALERLRPQLLGPMAATVSLSDVNFGRVPRYYVECRQDRAIPVEVQRRMYEAAGVRSVASLDTDHSPFYSATQGLAAAINGFVEENRTTS